MLHYSVFNILWSSHMKYEILEINNLYMVAAGDLN